MCVCVFGKIDQRRSYTHQFSNTFNSNAILLISFSIYELWNKLLDIRILRIDGFTVATLTLTSYVTLQITSQIKWFLFEMEHRKYFENRQKFRIYQYVNSSKIQQWTVNNRKMCFWHKAVSVRFDDRFCHFHSNMFKLSIISYVYDESRVFDVILSFSSIISNEN